MSAAPTTPPIRVAHLETGMKLYGGAYQVMRLLATLSQYGVESHLICPKGSQIAKAADEAGHRVYLLEHAGDLHWPMFGHIVQHLRQIKPDLLHVHSRRGADVFGGLAARYLGLPAVLSRRVDNPETRLGRLKYRLYEQVITISDAIGEVLKAAGIPPTQLTTVRSALDSEAFDVPLNPTRFNQLLGLYKNRRIVATVAQLIPRKGHELLIKAAPLIIQRHPDVLFVFFGQGKQQAALCEQILQSQLHDHFLLPGFVDDLAQILPGCYLLAHPAYREGLGISLLQAQAAGVPVITSETGGMQEAINAPYTGLFIPPGDHLALARQINHLLDKPKLRNQMAQAGRQWVRSEFSVPVMAQGNAAVYRRVLATTSAKV